MSPFFLFLGRQTFLSSRWEGGRGQTILTHMGRGNTFLTRRADNEHIYTQRGKHFDTEGGQTFHVGVCGGNDDVAEMENLSEANNLVSQARELSARARYSWAHRAQKFQ